MTHSFNEIKETYTDTNDDIAYVLEHTLLSAYISYIVPIGIVLCLSWYGYKDTNWSLMLVTFAP